MTWDIVGRLSRKVVARASAPERTSNARTASTTRLRRAAVAAEPPRRVPADASLLPLLAELARRMADGDASSALGLIASHADELLAAPGGPAAVLSTIARRAPLTPGTHAAQVARGAESAAWALVGACDFAGLRAVARALPGDAGHALSALASLQLDDAATPARCEACATGTEAGDEVTPLHELARACHHLRAGRAQAALAAAARAATTEGALARLVARWVESRASLMLGRVVDAAAGFAELSREARALGDDVARPLAELADVLRLRSDFSRFGRGEDVAEALSVLGAEATAPYVRDEARRALAFADGRREASLPDDDAHTSLDARVDAAEAFLLGGGAAATIDLIVRGLAGRAHRLGRSYLEARARMLVGVTAIAGGSADGLARAKVAVARARALAEAEGYAHVAARAVLLEGALAASESRATDGARHLDAALEGSSVDDADGTIERHVAEAALHRRPLSVLNPFERRMLELSGLLALPSWSAHDGRAAHIIGALEHDELCRSADLLIDLGRHELWVRGRLIRGCERIASVLSQLAIHRHRSLGPEELFLVVWRARLYRPDRHRNAVYLAVSRARRLLEPLLGVGSAIERDANGWRLRTGLNAIVIRSLRALQEPPDTFDASTVPSSSARSIATGSARLAGR